MASKTLRLPQGNEWKKLPRSKAQAIDRGLNRFIGKDGQLREIRRFGSRQYPQGTVERWSSRNQNRGGGTEGTRQLNEQLATPPWADKTKFGKAMSEANAMGLDGDHIREISRTAEGIRWLESTGRGTAKQMFDSYEKAGLPLGNQAGNVQPLNPKLNQQVKPAELRAMDEGIARAGQQSDQIFGKLGSVGFRSGTRTSTPQQTKPAQQPPKPEKPKRSSKSNLRSSMGTIGFGFSELTGGYTGADSMPRRVDMDPLGTGATIMIP